MAALGPVADVVDVDGDDAGLDGSLDDGLIEGAAEHIREEGENIDAHSYPILPHNKRN